MKLLASIHFLSVRNMGYSYDGHIELHFVNNAVVTNTNPS